MVSKIFIQSRKRYRKVGAFLGLLLGMGAPLGWLSWQFFSGHRVMIGFWLKNHISQTAEVYVYMAIGTVTVFTLFGYFLGRTSDVIAEQSDNLKGALDRTNTMALTDALTGVHNARYLHEQLQMELESAERYQTSLTCLMLDIDDFKKINDTYGHPNGDKVLVTLARRIVQCVRRIDIVGRLGGEEFLVVMPHTSSETAFSIAERIRIAVYGESFEFEETNISVSISIGVATFPAPGIEDKSSLLKAVDAALYEAKRTGKNKSVISGSAMLKV